LRRSSYPSMAGIWRYALSQVLRPIITAFVLCNTIRPSNRTLEESTYSRTCVFCHSGKIWHFFPHACPRECTASSDSHLAGHGNDQGEFSGSHRRVAFGVRGYWFDGIDHCLGIEDKCVVMGKQIEVLGGTIMAGKKLNDAPGVDGGVDWRPD
jgi:hypothetical protein